MAVFYLGGLWLTVRRVPTSRRPVALALGSFAVRGAVVVGAMVFIARLHWQLLLAAMGSFVLVRLVVTRRLRSEVAARTAGDESQA